MTYAYTPEAEDWTRNKAVYLCTNCGEDLGFKMKLTCENCSTAAKRKEMDEENERITKHLDTLREKGQWIYKNSYAEN